MTSNERKIINSLREMEGKTHIRLIAQKTNFSSDYVRLMCHSLARAGYVKLEDSNTCHLLKKGQGHFESVAVMREVSKPVVVTANVTLLTDEPAVVSLASNRSDEEESQEEGASDGKDKDELTSSDEELDKALSDLEPSSQKNESEEKEILAETEATEEEKIEKPDETELKSEPRAEEEKPAAVHAMASKEKELTEEAKAENPERVALKEEPAKPSGSSGWSFKKIASWFADKK